MVDLTNKRSDPDDGVTSDENEIKRCADCGTSKTPLWRTGPAGPKSLCNACGIRSRKRVRVISAEKSKVRVKSSIKFEKGRVFSSTKKNVGGGGNGSRSTSSTTSGSTITSTISSSSCKIRRSGSTTLDQRLLSFGREVMMQRSTVGKRLVRRRKLGEEEQAAVLLMALSYGSVYA